MSRDITPVEVMGRYSNPDNVARLRRVLSGQGRDRVSHRPVPSLRQKQTRLTDSQRSEVVERYQAGESSNVLAREFSIDRRTATRIIREAGAQIRYRIDADLDAARELYASGLSLAKVGKELGVSSGTVRNLLRRAGNPTRDVGTNQWR
jgi:DNA-directed RNA polymerase specialized sigma24 family protein